MKPKFCDAATWQQAAILMQPVFIRLVDNLRKQLEQSVWQGTYHDAPVWQEAVSDAVKAEVMDLKAALATASPDAIAVIERKLTQLPSPELGYHLCLSRQEQKITIDLWELCYQICFYDYDAQTGMSRGVEQPGCEGVTVDLSLFDEMGEVDWFNLDVKAQQVVAEVFAALPA